MLHSNNLVVFVTTGYMLQNTELDLDDNSEHDPRGPQGRNLREEQLASAAEARLLSIVSQVSTGHEEDSSPRQTAFQVSHVHAWCTVLLHEVV